MSVAQSKIEYIESELIGGISLFMPHYLSGARVEDYIFEDVSQLNLPLEWGIIGKCPLKIKILPSLATA